MTSRRTSCGSTSRDGTFRNTALLSGVALGANGRAQGQHGRRRRRLRQRRRRGPLHHGADRSGQHALRQRRHGPIRGSERAARASASRASPTPASGPPGSTSTTTAGWTSWPSTATSRRTWKRSARRQSVSAAAAQPAVPQHGAPDGFEEVTARAGAVFAAVGSRAAAQRSAISTTTATWTSLVGNGAGPLRLLINQRRQPQPLARAAAGRAEHARRDMVGARVAVVREDGPRLWRRARADGSYASANDPRVLVGLGESAAAVRVRVTWPSGRVETWSECQPIGTRR